MMNNIKTTKPFEKAIIDHNCLDIQINSTNQNIKLGRPLLTILVDDFSKRVIAFNLPFESQDYVTDLSYVQEMLKAKK